MLIHYFMYRKLVSIIFIFIINTFSFGQSLPLLNKTYSFYNTFKTNKFTYLIGNCITNKDKKVILRINDNQTIDSLFSINSKHWEETLYVDKRGDVFICIDASKKLSFNDSLLFESERGACHVICVDSSGILKWHNYFHSTYRAPRKLSFAKSRLNGIFLGSRIDEAIVYDNDTIFNNSSKETTACVLYFNKKGKLKKSIDFSKKYRISEFLTLKDYKNIPLCIALNFTEKSSTGKRNIYNTKRQRKIRKEYIKISDTLQLTGAISDNKHLYLQTNEDLIIKAKRRKHKSSIKINNSPPSPNHKCYAIENKKLFDNNLYLTYTINYEILDGKKKNWFGKKISKGHMIYIYHIDKKDLTLQKSSCIDIDTEDNVFVVNCNSENLEVLKSGEYLKYSLQN